MINLVSKHPVLQWRTSVFLTPVMAMGFAELRTTIMHAIVMMAIQGQIAKVS